MNERAALLVSHYEAIPFIFGRFQKILFLKLLVIVFLAEGTWNGILPFLILDVDGEFGLPSSQSGLYAVAFFAGEFFGALVFGHVSDRYGRRVITLASMGVSTVAGLCCAFCPVSVSVSLLLLSLALLGFGIGGTIPTIACIFSEFMPPEQRGFYLNAISLGFPVSALASAGAAWYLDSISNHGYSMLGFSSSESAWRILFACSGALEAICLVCMIFWLPESPRWLLVRGRRREAMLVLDVVAAYEGLAVDRVLKPDGDLLVINSGSVHNLACKDSQTEVAALMSLFTPTSGLRTTAILMIILWFLFSLASNGFFTLLPSLFTARGIESSSLYRDMVLTSACGVPGVLVAGFLLESRLGRRKTMGASMLMMAICMVGFQFVGSEWGATVCSAIMQFVACIAWSSLCTYTPEVFPTALRSTAFGMLTSFKCAGGIAGPYLAGFFVDSQSVITLVVFSAGTAVAAVCSWALPLETRLEQLRDT